MRHIANTINYNEVCLLDDGTDTININDSRCTSEVNKQSEEQIDGPITKVSVLRRVQTRLRA